MNLKKPYHFIFCLSELATLKVFVGKVPQKTKILIHYQP